MCLWEASGDQLREFLLRGGARERPKLRSEGRVRSGPTFRRIGAAGAAEVGFDGPELARGRRSPILARLGSVWPRETHEHANRHDLLRRGGASPRLRCARIGHDVLAGHPDAGMPQDVHRDLAIATSHEEAHGAHCAQASQDLRDGPRFRSSSRTSSACSSRARQHGNADATRSAASAALASQRT